MSLWTKKNILTDAAKYEFKHQWRKNSPAAYQAASRQNLIKEATKFLKDKPVKKLLITGLKTSFMKR